MTRALSRRLQLLLCAIGGLASAAVSLTLWILTILAIVLYGIWIGIPLSLATVWMTRRLAGLHRRVYGVVFGYDLPVPYIAPDRPGLIALVRTTLRDPATWRDLAWLVLDSSVGLTLAILGILEGILDLLVWPLPAGLSLRLAAWLGTLLLGPTETGRLATRVGELARSRADTLDSQASELRRIERDLHDGAQARLVAVGMTLALAEAKLVGDDPKGAQALLGEARAANSTALAELRDLVRGVHPPVLADRGLAGAIQALALTVPGEVRTRLDVPRRLPAPVESAAYFATAEALANAIKHSHATSIRIDVAHRDDRLIIAVSDDGIGGAAPDGSGLRGIQQRLAAFDGTLTVQSPPGGPTRLKIDLPVAFD